MIDEKTIDLIREKLEKHEICLTEYGVRLMKIEETAKDIRDLTISVREIAINQKNMGDKMSELTESITAIHEEPKKNWSTLKTAIISSIGGAVGTGIIGAIVLALAK